ASPKERWRAFAAAAGSRDPGEWDRLDEIRASAGVRGPRGIRIVAGAMDLGLAGGLIAGSRGRFETAVRPAARADRVPMVAAQGGALGGRIVSRLEGLAFAWRAERDARLLAGGLWPTSGRYHRSDLERSRRGALTETIAGAAARWRRA